MDGLMRILETALPVFATLALGMLCRRRAVFTRAGIAALKTLAVQITLPAVMLRAFATAQYTWRSAAVPLLVFALCALALALGFLACKVLRLPGRLTPYLTTGFEAGMLGYALFALLYKEESAARFAIVDLGQVLFVFTVYKAMLAGKGGWRGAIREAARSPVVWAIVAGLLLGTTGLYRRFVLWGAGGAFEAVVDFLAAPTSAVILLTVGYDLVPGEIRLRETAAIVAVRAGIMALLFGAAIFVNRRLLNGMVHEGALALLFILPPPYVLPVFADAADERAGVSSALSAFTVLSLLLFAALAALV